MASQTRAGPSSKRALTWLMPRSRSATCACWTASSVTSSRGLQRPRKLRRDGGAHVLVGATGVRKLSPGDRVRTDERNRFMSAAGQAPDRDVDVRHRHVPLASGARDGSDTLALFDSCATGQVAVERYMKDGNTVAIAGVDEHPAAAAIDPLHRSRNR